MCMCLYKLYMHIDRYNIADIHAYICIYMHRCMHTYIHTYVHTYIYTYIHT